MRCSVTELDALRRYRTHEEVELEALLRQLRREEEPSRAMLAGRALHHILEHAEPGQDLERAEHDGFRFEFGFEGELQLPRVRELKGEVVIATSVCPVTLVGVVDGIDGVVRDYKLTSRWDPERYIDSLQWRCYLRMFGATRFDYDVFVARDDEPSNIFWIYEYHPMRFYAYPGLDREVESAVDEFARFAAVHLPERFAERVAA